MEKHWLKRDLPPTNGREKVIQPGSDAAIEWARRSQMSLLEKVLTEYSSPLGSPDTCNGTPVPPKYKNLFEKSGTL